MTANESIETLKARIARGETTAQAVTESALNDAEKLNDTLNAFLQLDRPGALARAAEIDEGLAKQVAIPVLSGSPIAIKDNICVRGMQASCGSKILGGYHPPYNATVIDRLLSA